MSLSKPSVLLFQDDFQRMQNWVLQYPNSETGGQFFGLWANSKDPYINVVIGPGKNCRHGTHSFHQDIEYLKNTGTFLNEKFMTCHIGEWHSHHRLRIREPSSGDLNSVWNHFPSGVEHFLLVIATIEGEGTVELWPYLFTASSHEHKLIGCTIIEKDNVFMKADKVKETIARGVENAPEKWFLTDWGAHFVQCLNSNLEEMVSDKSSTIEKHFNPKRQSSLQFSFYFRGFYCTITFPRDFPVADLTCRIGTNDRKCCLKEWKEKVKHSESLEDFAQILLKRFHNCVTKQFGNAF